jgi:GT2 family glycosyltransferase
VNLADVGVVLIGRNEGERLVRALDSLPAGVGGAVYVDSGSTDGSVAAARAHGLDVVELDLATPFTAARARNAGFARLAERHPGLEAVMFLDGDCRLAPGWLEAAADALTAHPAWVAVCGWRRERHPEASLYNRLCDLEWIAPPTGDVGDFGFGGDVMIRSDAFRAVGGYDAGLIAGEDPELSARLRWAGGEVVRLDRAMSEHDADIHRLGAWWRRSERAGHAFAEVAHRHRERGLFARNLRSTWIFGLAVPGGALALAPWQPWLAAALLALWPLQALRVARSLPPRFGRADGLLWGASCMVSQVPKLQGTLRFHANRLRGRRQRLLEYKG